MLHAMLKRIALPLPGRFDHLVCGLRSMLAVASEIDGRTHSRSYDTLRLSAGALAQHLLILLTNPRPWTAIIRKVDDGLRVVLVKLCDIDLRTHEDRLF